MFLQVYTSPVKPHQVQVSLSPQILPFAGVQKTGLGSVRFVEAP